MEDRQKSNIKGVAYKVYVGERKNKDITDNQNLIAKLVPGRWNL